MNVQPNNHRSHTPPTLTFAPAMILIAVVLLVGWAPGADAAVCTSQTAGNWSTITWDCVGPVTGDDIIIATDVTLDIAAFTANALTVNFGFTFDIAGNTFTITTDLTGQGAVNFTTGRLFIGGDAGGCGDCQEVALTGSPDVTYDGLAGQLINKSTYTSLIFGPGSYHDYFETYGVDPVYVEGDLTMRDGAMVKLDGSFGAPDQTFDGSTTASFTMEGASELRVGGESTAAPPAFPQNFASYTISPDSTVVYGAAADQLGFPSTPNYGHLGFEVPMYSYSFATRSPDGDLTTQGDVWVADFGFGSSSVTLDMAGNSLVAEGGLRVEGFYATFDGGLGTHFIGGDIEVLDGSIIDPGTFVLNGTVPQLVTGAIDFQNLTLQNDVTVDVSSGVSISGTLDLGSNVLTIQGGGGGIIPAAIPGSFTLLASATTSYTTGYLVGPVDQQFNAGQTKTIPVGAGGISSPVTITVDSVISPPASFLVEAFATQAPGTPPGSANLYWDLSPANVGQADVVFTYDPATLPFPESDYRPARWDGFQWVVPAGATIDPATNTATVLNQPGTEFSIWTLIPAASCTVTTTADGGIGSLREAINNANAGTCGPSIEFAIAGTGPHTITLGIPLPDLTASGVTIDAFTGSQAGASANTNAFGSAVNASWPITIQGDIINYIGSNLLPISGSNNVVRGLAFDATASGDAIYVTGSGNVIAGNLFTNGGRGVEIFAGTGNVVGGAAPADRNVFDGFFGSAIQTDGTSAATQIKGNYIGFNATGGTGAGNSGYGINVQGAANVLIDQNVVSNSGLSIGSGIYVNGDSVTISGDNRIGTNTAGTAALPNGASASMGAVGIHLATGGTNATINGNLISGHTSGGLGFYDAGILVQSANNDIYNNRIGTDVGGAGSIPNGFGIFFDTGATGNVVGGGLGANTIMANSFDGIVATGGSGNEWFDNAIFANGGMAVDLGNDDVVNNDAGDADTGANGLQNPPTITSAVLDSGTLYTTVSLDSSTPNPSSVLIEIVSTDVNGQINATVGTQCVAGSVLAGAPVNLAAGTVTGGSLIAGLATSYSDAGCATVADGSSEVGASFAVVANTPPVAGADSVTTPEDTAVTFAAGANDSDAESGVSIVSWTQGANGTADCSAYPSCTYTPNLNFNGSDSFTYTIQDAFGLTATATVSMTVTAVNDPPVAVDDSAITDFETPVTIPVLANDTDIDGDALTVASAGTPGNGTVTCTATDCTYTPAAGFGGTDSFTYTVSDGQGGTAVGTVTVTVTPATDVAITKSGPDSAVPGATVGFTIVVTNIGPIDALDVVVADPTPSGLVHVANSGDCTTPFPCQLGTMAPGTTKTITATFEVLDPAPQTVVNTASVTTTSPQSTTSNDSASASVKICPLAPDDLLPASGATSVPLNGQLTWSDSGAALYEVFLGPVGSGCSTSFGQTIAPGISYSGLDSNTQYEWRVVASRAGCQDTSSACQTFTTGPGACPSGQPQLIEPAAASTQPSPVTFSWTPVEGAIGYDVAISEGGGPHVIVFSTAETIATITLAPGPVSWYIEAQFDGCPSTRSATSSFTVESGECSDEAPELVAPVAGASGLSSPVEFRWTPVLGASSYRVWVESEDSFPVVVGTTSATTWTAMVPSGELHWYVQALFEGCPPTISEVRTIQVDMNQGCPSDRPELISPTSGSELDSPIQFQWTAVPGAVRYAVWASIDGDTESVIGTTEGEANTTLERSMDSGQIEWFVEVFFDGCPSLKTDSTSFIVNQVIECVSDAPQLLLPASGATGVPGLVKFQWTSVPTAVGYRLWLKTDGVGEFELAAATLAETEIQVPVRGNLVEWYVEAVFQNCPLTRSQNRTFTIQPPTVCNDDASELIMPIGGVTVSENRVNLVWTAVDGADAYNVWVVRENGARSRVGLTSGDELSIEVDLEEGDHEWWVTALFAGCSSVDSEHESFSIDTGVSDECDSNSELLLVSPSEGSANIESPVIFEWTAVPGATEYQIWLLEGENDTPRALGGVREETQAIVRTNVGTIRWYVEALRAGCPPIQSAIQHFKVKPTGLVCDIPDKPIVYVPQNVAGGTEYRISWDQVPGATVYEIQESTSRNFRGVPVRVVRGTSTSYVHTAGGGLETYFYRVRAIGDCNGERGSYSQVAVVSVDASSTGASAGASRGYHVSAENLIGSEILELNKDAYSQNDVEEFTVVLRSPGSEPETVRLVPDQSWFTVDPEIVTLTPSGVTVTIRAEMGDLPLGTNSATLRYEPVAGKGASQGGTMPVSVSLVTPVTSTGKNTPLPESLIIPAVAHADGVNSTWLSDIRLTNLGAVSQKYQINFTPAGVDGTKTGQTTNVDVKAGSTVALNDVLANWFGAVGEDSQQTGMLEIRPLKSSTSSSLGGLAAVSSGGFTSLASSRTYNFTPNGTFGQFIPAIRFEKFVGVESDSGTPRLSMQQVSQSSSFRTNLGIVEASGNAVDALVSVFDQSGSLVGSFTVNLKAGEHRQLNLQQQGISVENGRIEVTAANGQGRLMAYGSVVDNTTNDPQLVPSVTLGEDSGSKWVLPGVADLETGQASWRTDVRILNPDGAARTVKLTYYPQNDPGTKKEASLTLESGEIEILDDLLASFFGETNTGGVVHVETDSTTNLVTTGRTYNLEAGGGTFGQFIPAVNAGKAIGRGEQALQILQVEQSDRFRANLGLAEVTGQPAQVEVSAVIPGAKTSVKAVVPLRGNEFTQLVGVLSSLGISEAYNARISVRVINGGGKVVAYGSIIDNETQDPTYVPAQ